MNVFLCGPIWVHVAWRASPVTSTPGGGKRLQSRARLPPDTEGSRACTGVVGATLMADRLVMGDSRARGRENGKPESCGVGSETRSQP